MVLAYAGRLSEYGHQVLIYTNIVKTVFKIPHDVELHRVACSGKIGTILSTLLHRIKADVVIGDIVVSAFFLSFRNWGRVVHFAQDYNENVYSNILQKTFIRVLYRITLSLFKVPTIAVSAQLADELNDRFNAQALVIENGIDLRAFYPEPSSDLMARKNGRKAILFFSRRDHRKGFDLALEAIARLSSETSLPFEVWTVGEKLRKGEVSCSHHDFGYVTEAELRRTLSSADVLLYPSRCEGFPLMVLEAFACQCPVVTTEAVSYAVDDDNALVARVEDVEGMVTRVKRILEDQELAGKLADTAGKFVQQYSLDSAAKAFEKQLNTLL